MAVMDSQRISDWRTRIEQHDLWPGPGSGGLTGVHASLNLCLLDALCAGDAQRIDEASGAAEVAISTREHLWDGVRVALN